MTTPVSKSILDSIDDPSRKVDFMLMDFTTSFNNLNMVVSSLEARVKTLTKQLDNLSRKRKHSDRDSDSSDSEPPTKKKRRTNKVGRGVPKDLTTFKNGKERCLAVTRKGGRCARAAEEGMVYCTQRHRDLEDQPLNMRPVWSRGNSSYSIPAHKQDSTSESSYDESSQDGTLISTPPSPPTLPPGTGAKRLLAEALEKDDSARNKFNFYQSKKPN